MPEVGFEPGSTTIKRTSCLTYPLDHGSFTYTRTMVEKISKEELQH